ncbi:MULTISPECIES: PfkB family carbohydrate kinase [unclassified Microbacterium]|uniref:PfkB family carbohydrate kinase n=1 Tax=unclassified Microbacterium TaxID=2609290 RepID=UPI00214C4F7A|nr:MULTISPECIES: PfkB family carbohydrate kinase [unclassified Microbacterium]MCR2784470.1 PfkB family carbohydrate kinase [Microbacterium sp. zg.B96]WIM14718.1 PfkB family carbohydrate kinase [Microbacterium sp. zg-B96]
MSAAPDVVVIGEALVDIVHAPDGTRESPGGSPANVALALGRRGLRPLLVTQLADDSHGRAVRAWLDRSAVTVHVPGAPARTSTAVAHLDAEGAATYEFDIAWDLAPWRAPVTPVVHTGSIAAVLHPGADTVEQALRDARRTAAVTFDPNVRPSLITDAADVRARVARLVALSDVVKVSGEDLDWLHPGRDHRDIAREWLRAGPALVVVTEGAAGSFAVHAAGVVEAAAAPVAVVDTVGAGDTFMAALIAQLHARTGADVRARIAGWDAADIAAVLVRSAAAAAITVSRPGADPPWAHELATP